MNLPLLGLVLLMCALNWLAGERGWKALAYFSKPASMLLLLVWFWQTTGLRGSMGWFALGLLASLAGDVLLMLPHERFRAGLAAFLLAHLLYTGGFLSSGTLNLSQSALLYYLLIGLVLGLIQEVVYRKLRRAMQERGLAQMQMPVRLYMWVITVMSFSALGSLVRPEWPLTAGLFAAGGSILFLISDCTLAWRKFVRPLRHAHLRVMVTYHLAQVGILLGAALYALS